MIEANGIPLTAVVDGANRHDMKLVGATLEAVQFQRPQPTPEQPGLWLDKGYDYDEVQAIVQEFGFTAPRRAQPPSGNLGVRASPQPTRAKRHRSSA